MEGMPQMVGLLNAFGGLAAGIEGIAVFCSENAEFALLPETNEKEPVSRIQFWFLMISIVVGFVTFVGSLIACAKLSGYFKHSLFDSLNNTAKASITVLCFLIFIILMILAYLSGYHFEYMQPYTPAMVRGYVHGMRKIGWVFILLLTIFSICYGFIFVVPIGGADMPVVISVLNSFSGLSGCCAGFMCNNDLLITTGALVASSGMILSYVMCVGMNRSLVNVLAGGFGSSAPKPSANNNEDNQVEEINKKEPIETNEDEICKLLESAQEVMIIPGYGMAQAQAQRPVADLTKAMQDLGINVRFGIHPVAGRLPGHMNVLLAEANVPYDIVFEMDEINNDMKNVDVCFVIGANDTVNPQAEENPNCSIAGMPIIKAYNSKHVVVLKRGKGQGYAALDNTLFTRDNSRMLYGSADKTVASLANKVKELKKGNAFGGADGEGENPLSPTTAEKEEALKKKKEFKMPDKFFKTIGIPREQGFNNENRVAMTPDVTLKMLTMGFKVIVESDAGVGCHFSNQEYIDNHAEIMDKQALFENADIIIKHNEPSVDEIALLQPKHVLISYASPDSRKDLLEAVKNTGASWIAMDKVPRTSAAQKLDSLSSAGKIAGYRCVVEALSHYQGFFSAQITAAGKYPPAQVLIIGAGVAGLEAIGAAKALGAKVYCFDSRAECKEQVESMGGNFLTINIQESGAGAGGYAKVMSKEYVDAEIALFKEKARICGVVISTAAIPGRRAPVLIPKDTVDAMQSGSVIVDLSARSGGTCELTRADEVYVTDNGVTIIGYVNFSARMSRISSEMYANNIFRLLEEMSMKDIKDPSSASAETFRIDTENKIVRTMLVTHNNDITYPPPKELTAAPPPAAAKKDDNTRPAAGTKPDATAAKKDEGLSPQAQMIMELVLFIIAAIFCVVFCIWFPKVFNRHLLVLALSCIVGYNSVWSVAPCLYTPLMSLTNAISGVVILGGIPLILDRAKLLSAWLGLIAIFVASINIGGGFCVTQRMLNMFQAGGPAKK